MFLSHIRLYNIKSFVDATVPLSNNITLLIGKNNSGKSTIIQSILCLNEPANAQSMKRAAQSDYSIFYSFSDKINHHRRDLVNASLSGSASRWNTPKQTQGGREGEFTKFQTHEPENLIHYFSATRSSGNFEETINLSSGRMQTGGFKFLPARIDNIISNPQDPAHELFKKHSHDLLGFNLGLTLTGSGKTPTFSINRDAHIDIRQMGSGVIQSIGLIIDLISVENKLILIEEPENDLHPTALRTICKAISESASKNQFIISTHSNVVLSELGSNQHSRILHITSSIENGIPTSKLTPIDNGSSKIQLLRELGYELSDYDMWEYWIIFEEQSAERIVRQFIMPIFFPHLCGKIRTIAASGIGDIKNKIHAIHNTMLTIHLSKVYSGRCWVIADSGENETKILNDLKMRYVSKDKDWRDENFIQWQEHDFEEYYPEQFRNEFRMIKESSRKNNADIRPAKKSILEKTIAFLERNNQESARSILEECAREVINVIEKINESIHKTAKRDQ